MTSNAARKDLSDLELSLLRHLAASEGQTVREVADSFGQANGYARTTIQTLLERMRAKNYVSRQAADGGYVYRSVVTPGELMRNVVGSFVDKALGGSVSPLVSYLVEQGTLTEEEIRRLEALVEQLKDGRDDA
jgi:predicted transcriptional regulator